MSDRIKADLEALGRLRPQLDELAQSIQGDIPVGGAAAGGADPALMAIAAMSGRTLPNVQKVVAAWMGQFGDVCEAGRQGVITTEEQATALMKKVPSLHRQSV